jgi:hypothetical protein
MDQANGKTDFGGLVRRTWNAVVRAAEAIELTPMEDAFDRLDRLEREMASLKKREAAGIDSQF